MISYFPSAVSLVLVTMVKCSICAAQETCSKLEFTGFRQHGNTVSVKHNSYVNVIFHLETSHCPYSPEWFRVRMTRNQSGLQADVCTVMFHNATCQVTDQSESCRCIPGVEASVELYKNFSQTGRTVYTWALSDSERKQPTRKVMITFDVVKERGSEKVREFPGEFTAKFAKGSPRHLQLTCALQGSAVISVKIYDRSTSHALAWVDASDGQPKLGEGRTSLNSLVSSHMTSDDNNLQLVILDHDTTHAAYFGCNISIMSEHRAETEVIELTADTEKAAQNLSAVGW